MLRINASVVTLAPSILIACVVGSRAMALPQDGIDAVEPFQPRYVEVDEFNMGAPWLFDRREPSPGLLNGGFYDPHSIYRHHGGGIGTTQHYEGPYRHHDIGHAYYDDPSSMKRFHGLGDGGAQRRGRYDYRRYFLNKYWYDRGSTCHSCMPFVESPPPHDVRYRTSPTIPPVTQPARPPMFFYEPPGDDEVEPIPLEDVPNRTWVMLNEGDAESAVVLFAIDAARSPENVEAKVGFAVASAMIGKGDRAALVMRDALQIDAKALDRPEISKELRTRIASLATGLEVDPCGDRFLIASLLALAGETADARQILAQIAETHAAGAAAVALRRQIDAAESRRLAAAEDFAADVLMMLTHAR
jgi:hypothetical protein